MREKFWEAMYGLLLEGATKDSIIERINKQFIEKETHGKTVKEIKHSIDNEIFSGNFPTMVTRRLEGDQLHIKLTKAGCKAIADLLGLTQ